MRSRNPPAPIVRMRAHRRFVERCTDEPRNTALKNLQYADGTITVRRALAHVDDGYYIKESKTGSSIRTIPLTPYMRNLLGAMRDNTKHMFERLSTNFKQVDPCILGAQTTDSRPYNPTASTRTSGRSARWTASTAPSTICATPLPPWPSATASMCAP